MTDMSTGSLRCVCLEGVGVQWLYTDTHKKTHALNSDQRGEHCVSSQASGMPQAWAHPKAFVLAVFSY